MIKVTTVDLNSFNVILPYDRVGMVIAQPYVTLTPTEPYRHTETAKAELLLAIKQTLDVAIAAHHGASKTHFTIFPEYSIPGLAGIALIEHTINAANWQSGTVIIGGTDALTKDEFLSLTRSPNSHFDNNATNTDNLAENEWVNCCIIWVKAENGNIQRWLQPKLSRAWEEQAVQFQDMFQGKGIYVFRGLFDNNTRYHFTTLVCYDWIATVDGKKPWRWVLDDLHEQAQLVHAEISLTWAFVIQRNPKPSHDSFLLEVAGFFDQTITPDVLRSHACLIFANNAGRPTPGNATKFGCAGLVYSSPALFTTPTTRQTCRPTFCIGEQRFRPSTLLLPFFDVLFREHGACLHSFSQINPKSIVAGAAGRSQPIDHACVYPLLPINDPRLPSGPVPACVKWINDELDAVLCISALHSPFILENKILPIHQHHVTTLRTINAQQIALILQLATANQLHESVDKWANEESGAIEHLIHTIDIMGLGFPGLSIGSSTAHATLMINGKTLILIATRGHTHAKCIERLNSFPTPLRREVLLISRDRDNTRSSNRLKSFLSVSTAPSSAGRNITNPGDSYKYLGYQNILEALLRSQSPEELKELINVDLK